MDDDIGEGMGGFQDREDGEWREASAGYVTGLPIFKNWRAAGGCQHQGGNGSHSVECSFDERVPWDEQAVHGVMPP